MVIIILRNDAEIRDFRTIYAVNLSKIVLTINGKWSRETGSKDRVHCSNNNASEFDDWEAKVTYKPSIVSDNGIFYLLLPLLME